LLAGRTALVTGASRGIGAAIARSLAAEGTRIALVARNREALDQLASEIGQRSFAAPCELTDAASVESMSLSVGKEFGAAPDIIVNNAGVFEVARLDTMPASMFTRVVDTNLVAPFLIVQAFLAQMRKRGSGHFVTIGSVADRNIFPENGAYAPAKYALRAMHEVLRSELKGSGVRATLVSPGSVDTAMWDDVSFGGEERIIPQRNVMLAPDDIAAAVIYALTQPPTVNIDELRLSHS
jgi:NADP-dependent 3-hydroxy acid dehydrogenase YdfG